MSLTICLQASDLGSDTDVANWMAKYSLVKAAEQKLSAVGSEQSIKVNEYFSSL
jgi:hypothetical protein